MPDVVRGRAGQAWVDALPGLVADLQHRWSVRAVEQLFGGHGSVCVRVEPAAVIKLSVPGNDFALEVDTLRRAEGRGYVKVLAADLDHDAALLELLGPSLVRSDLPPEAQLEVLGDLLSIAWTTPRPAGPDAAEPEDKATGLLELVGDLWATHRGTCPGPVVAEALRCAAARAADFERDRCVVVHGDAAAANVLQAPSERDGSVRGWLLVDPDGFVGDPAYDLGVALRDWAPQVLADPTCIDRYADLLGRRTGQDPTAISEWAFLERVSTGLYVDSFGAPETAEPFFRSAEAILRRSTGS